MPPEITGAEPSSATAVLLLAVLQGLAEFLPVSSSGHLVLARAALRMREAGLALDVALHVGTLLAVVWAYRREVRGLFADLAAGRLRDWLWLALATVPIGIVGLLAKDLVEEAARRTEVAGIGFFCTAAALVAGEHARGRLGPAAHAAGTPGEIGRPRWSDAVALGIAQMFAILPGISRSGATIAAGLVRGLPVAQAARLSFLMSLPAVTGAAVVELPGAVGEGFGGLPLGLVLGAIALSALVGWAALRALLLVTARGAFRWFAAYCALLGTLTLLFA